MCARFHLFVLSALVLLAACAASPQPQRYVLESLPPVTAPVERAGGATIGIGNLVLPAYLDRLAIVCRSGNRLTIDDSKHWAEPLFDAVPRVLLANLSVLLTDARLVQAPWGSQSRPDLKLVLRISRLESVDNKTVELRASWSILDQQEVVVFSNEVELSEPVLIEMTPADETSAVVTAHAKVLIALSRIIAGDINKTVVKKEKR